VLVDVAQLAAVLLALELGLLLLVVLVQLRSCSGGASVAGGTLVRVVGVEPGRDALLLGEAGEPVIVGALRRAPCSRRSRWIRSGKSSCSDMGSKVPAGAADHPAGAPARPPLAARWPRTVDRRRPPVRRLPFISVFHRNITMACGGREMPAGYV